MSSSSSIESATARRPPSKLAEFSDEERRVLKECKHESFYYRCLPFSAVLMAATQKATMSGYLSAHPRYGSTLKLIGAALAGFIIGKASYIGACRKKLLSLPNSRLAEHLKLRKHPQEQTAFDSPLADRDDYHMSAPATSHEIDDKGRDYDTSMMNQQQVSGLDDRQRPSVDSNETNISEPQQVRQEPKAATYEELRKKNREGYEPEASRSQRGFGRQPWSQPQPLGITKPSPRDTVKETPAPKKIFNKYGDEME